MGSQVALLVVSCCLIEKASLPNTTITMNSLRFHQKFQKKNTNDNRTTMGLHLSGHNKDEANKDLDSFQSGKKQLTGKELVAEKLTKMYGKQLSNEDLDKFATILSDVEKLKKVYLHTDFQQAQQLVCTSCTHVRRGVYN